mgnify:CR=1 FL=1
MMYTGVTSYMNGILSLRKHSELVFSNLDFDKIFGCFKSLFYALKFLVLRKSEPSLGIQIEGTLRYRVTAFKSTKLV